MAGDYNQAIAALEAENQHVLDGLYRMLSERYADELNLCATAAAVYGKPCKVWFDAEADSFRFEVIEDYTSG